MKDNLIPAEVLAATGFSQVDDEIVVLCPVTGEVTSWTPADCGVVEVL